VFEITIQIIGMIICIVLSAFCSCSETSLFSITKSKLSVLSKQGTPKEKLIAYHLSHASNLLITILIVNMFVNIFATSLSERITSKLFSSCSLGVSIVGMTLIVILFGEITPKIIGVNNSQKISLFVIPIINIFYKIVSPLRIILYKSSNYIISKFSHFLGADIKSTYDELLSMVSDSHQAGILYKHEKEMIEGIIDLQQLKVNNIMTPRTEMICFDVNDPTDRIFNGLKKGKFSRIPIYENNIDNIIGILYVKDFLMVKKEVVDLRKILRKPHFVPESKNSSELFTEMRGTSIHMAIVVDEYGGVAGLVTLEDILEEIFGDILDKKDALLSLKKISPNLMKISGRLTIDDFNEIFKANIYDPINNTIGGHLMTKFGYIPKKGNRITVDEFEFTISLAKKNRIEEILVNRKKRSSKTKEDYD